MAGFVDVGVKVDADVEGKVDIFVDVGIKVYADVEVDVEICAEG